MTSALSFQSSAGNTGAASGSTFQGLSSGIQTNQLVQAEIAQASLPMQQLEARQAGNTKRSSALSALEGKMSTLSSDLDGLTSNGLQSRLVTSSDPGNSYVTATASGGAAGTYRLQVQNTATSAQILPCADADGNPDSLAVPSASSAIYSGASATFALEDTNGVTREITLDHGNNTLSALADAINALQTGNPSSGVKGLGIQATVVNTGSGSNPYELVLGSTTTGSGSAGNTIKIADITGNNTLGIAAGTASPTPAVLSPTLVGGAPSNLSVASPTSPVFTDSSSDGDGTASFALQDTDGNVRSFTLTGQDNTLDGMAGAINGLGLGVSASVGSVGIGANARLGLTLTATTPGPGAASSNITLAETSPAGVSNTLGIAAGTLSGDGSALATGGTQSNQAAQTVGAITSGGTTSGAAADAQFTLDGIQMTRSSNTITDAVPGVSFSLLQGDQAGTTTLTVAPDVATATKAMQAVITDYNDLMSTYATDSAANGPLNGDYGSQALMGQIQAALTGAPKGMAASAAFNSAASLGISTGQTGALALNSATFQAALAKDPAAVANVFSTSATSTNAAVAMAVSGPNTVTGALGFNITSYSADGAVAGTFTTPDGAQYQLTGTHGLLVGAQGTPLDGLYLNVSGTGTGTLTLSKGAGQATQDLISNLTDPASGTITNLLNNISRQNTDLTTQIKAQQSMLQAKQAAAEKRYSQMETTLGQLQSSQQSIGSMT
jgi:flagellar hook-associated protein 2